MNTASPYDGAPPPRAPMPGWQKALIAVGIMTVLAIGACALSIFGASLWLKNKLPSLADEARAMARDADQFARGRPQSACVPEAFRRSGPCTSATDLSCLMRSGGFLDICLRSAQPVEGFCQSVPSARTGTPSGPWRTQLCAAHGNAPPHVCNNLATILQRYCDNPRPVVVDGDGGIARGTAPPQGVPPTADGGY